MGIMTHFSGIEDHRASNARRHDLHELLMISLCSCLCGGLTCVDMADYAGKHCEGVDPVLVSTLHSDAMQIRVCVLMGLAQYAFSQASEGVRVNAFRAASMYTSMAARMTQLLQDHAAVVLPDFVAAM